MATPYTNYFPATYQPVYPQQMQYQQPVQQVQPQQPQGNGITWIQGIEAAKSYLIAPNTSVVLMDSENPFFYIKSADQSGMPTLRVFKFEEVTGQQQQPKVETAPQIDTSMYITRDEFEKRIAELTAPKQRNNQQQRKETKQDG